MTAVDDTRHDGTQGRDWELDAVCRPLDPEVWFRKADRSKAREFCEACPVAARCLETVMRREEDLSAGYRHGIFAGLTGPERAALARARERAREEALEEETPATPKSNAGRPLSPCGTRAAYQRHLSKGEPVDDACRAANTVSKRQYQLTGSSVLPAGR
ncbi:WhiB family transcriptional regulator [Streptomyces cyslabdanicus]|uniref:WhiB family transcriptional regulator n=1 Tax=Streptomyces cyslabdanicus TaxID=1470456 RepID=UPI004044DB6C